MSDENTSVAAPETTNTESTEQTPASEQGNVAVEAKAELKEALNDPNLSKTEKKEISKKIKELTLKIDGKTVREALPFEIDAGGEAEEYLKKQLQLSKMGQKRAQHSKALESEISEFFKSLQEDPRSVLSNPALGIDMKKFVNSFIEEEIENSRKTPEQLEKETLQKELKKMKDEREKEKKTAQEQEFERLTQTAYQNYEANVIKTIDGAKDLPKSPYVVKKFADFMMSGLKMGAELSPEDVLPLVRAQISSEIKEMFAASPDEMLEAMLGKDRLTQLRRKNIEKAKSVPQTAPLKSVKDVALGNSNKSDAKKATYKQFFKL